MTKLTDFQVSNNETTDFEQFTVEDYTVIIEWNDEVRKFYVFHEADLVYEGDSWEAVQEAVDTDFTVDAFRCLDVTYMERK